MKKLISSILIGLMAYSATGTNYYFCMGTCTGVASVTINNGGSGYAGTLNVTISGNGCLEVEASATQSGGVINSVTIDDADPYNSGLGKKSGYGCTGVPTVSITGSGGGSGFVGTAVLTATMVGSDSNDGLTLTTPFKTVAKFDGTVMGPGNKARFENGIYNFTNFGRLQKVCGASDDGALGNEFIVEAVNHRRAEIHADSGGTTDYAFKAQSCDDWIVQDLRFSSVTNSTNPHTVFMYLGNRPTFRRNLLYNANDSDVVNAHHALFSTLTGGQVYENECTGEGTRDCIDLNATDNMYIARNFCGGPNLSGTAPDDCIANYPGSANSVLANNFAIGPWLAVGTDIAQTTNQHNKWLGNASLNTAQGWNGGNRGDTAAQQLHDIQMENNAFINTNNSQGGIDLYQGGPIDQGSIFKHVTLLAGGGSGTYGIRISNGPFVGNCNYDLTIKDTIVKDIGTTQFGIWAEDPPVADDAGNCSGSGGIATGTVTWDNVWVSDFTTQKTPSSGTSFSIYTSVLSTSDNGHAQCYLWCADGANCKGAASDGGDMGATILYQYNSSGVLDTSNKLWDTTTGEALFRHGTVVGINSDPLYNLVGIQTLFHINTGGCTFPSAYSPTPTPTQTFTPTYTFTPTATLANTNTPTNTPTPSNTPTRTSTPAPACHYIVVDKHRKPIAKYDAPCSPGIPTGKTIVVTLPRE